VHEGAVNLQHLTQLLPWKEASAIDEIALAADVITGTGVL
jgi:hypothetical protein